MATLSLAAYAPLAVAYGGNTWTDLGPLQFQTSRLVHYFVYFAIGVGIGGLGLQNGLVASGGRLARRWWLWALAMLGAYLLAVGLSLAAAGAKGPTKALLADLGTVTFGLSCAASRC